MSQLIVISAIGRDRPGAVHDLSECVLECGGNILESKMTRLGREFAMLVLVSGNWATLGKLEQAMRKLEQSAKLTITLRQTDTTPLSEEIMPYAVDVVCLDQRGIVFQLARFMTAHKIDISEVNTRNYAAAHTGAPMFSVQMHIGVPASTSIAQLREEFMEFSDSLNLDAIIEPVKA